MARSVRRKPSPGVGQSNRPARTTESARRRFAHRFTKLLNERHLSLSETARRMREFLPPEERFADSNLSHYRAGRSMPRGPRLEALSRALGVNTSELVPSIRHPELESLGSATSIQRAEPFTAARGKDGLPDDQETRPGAQAASGERASTLVIEDLGTEVRLQFDQRLPWETALEVLDALVRRRLKK